MSGHPRLTRAVPRGAQSAPPKYRAAKVLRDAGWSYVEIAALFDANPARIKDWVSRAQDAIADERNLARLSSAGRP